MPANAPTITVAFGVNNVYTNVSADLVLQVEIRRGRQYQNDFLEAGTATVILNNQTGAFDPSNTSSAYYSILVAGMQVRITANSTVIYTGVLEDNTVNQGIYPTVSLVFVDGMAQIAKAIAPALATSSFSETAALRATRALDLAGWPGGGSRSLTGTTTMLATAQGMSCLEMLEQAANCIGGRFYVSRTGVATLVPLSDKFTRPTQLLFSDQGDANSVQYDGLITNPGTDYVYNEAISYRGPGQTQYAATYSTSVSTYGLKSKRLDAPTATAASAQNLALYAARKDADAVVLAEQIDFTAIGIGALATDLLETELNDLVQVKRLTYDARNITIDCVVEGLAHSITSDNWRVSIFTSVVDPYTITI
ncbi:hypothetical protein UFOVP1462_32 [uncultured Caudovirales phage]|uniref:Tail protein n=1 Tax=uncultured Caudovirales phage TaxID=2100421 RepID=A0A6J5SKM2_9CAUD|nr:hypothetical protein UFOVP1013_32 [uncultured Caudovirales phage]CAB4202941.1 hypothetical protein UFOVP1364_49 [uncultured Caudovirales phage]CAB4214356.1 hypothetical protein UFOVP1462_32 [uncultured Caudovirales phage]CAB5228805.1 hypothetical protein UFOVP1550_41 [uncultured Caudovirales phage]